MNLPLYSALIYLLLPVALLKLLWRAMRQPEYLQHIPERLGFYGQMAAGKPIIWLHAVSVGETRAAAPLVQALQVRFPEHQILLTHTTPTGRAAGEQLFGEQVMRVYLPYDFPGAARRFIRHFRPQLGVLMETELWFNLIHEARRANVPVALVNARMSAKSARGYTRLGKVVHAGLRQLMVTAAQTEADAERLKALGAQEVNVAGNLKFDVSPPPEAFQLGAELRQQFGTRPIFLAASTRDNEEGLVLDAVAQANIPDLLTVIVPRHPQRFNEVEALIRKRGLGCVRRSENREVPADCSVVLGDSMGEMFAYYAACDVAFIGGSLLPLGGQNLIEAAAMGKPVLIGPHTWNFAAVAEHALAAGAALRVADVGELAAQLQTLFANAVKRETMSQKALAFGAQHQGACQRLLLLLAPLLPKI